jgi:putative transposase
MQTKGHAHSGDCRFAAGHDGARTGRLGYGAGKKIDARTRHIAVDAEGNLPAGIVHSAGIQDRVAARAAPTRLFCRFDSIATVFAGGGHTGQPADEATNMS